MSITVNTIINFSHLSCLKKIKENIIFSDLVNLYNTIKIIKKNYICIQVNSEIKLTLIECMMKRILVVKMKVGLHKELEWIMSL